MLAVGAATVRDEFVVLFVEAERIVHPTQPNIASWFSLSHWRSVGVRNAGRPSSTAGSRLLYRGNYLGSSAIFVSTGSIDAASLFCVTGALKVLWPGFHAAPHIKRLDVGSVTWVAVVGGGRYKIVRPSCCRQNRPVKRWLAAILLVLVDTAAVAGGLATQPGGGQLYDVNGVRLFVEISGKGSPILFLHGGLSYFDEAFAAQKAYFATFRTVIGVDQRGHGHSPDTDQPFSYHQMAEDTAALLRQLQVGRVDVVGHSDGGNVGLLLARYHPELVRRLVISGANSRADYDGLLAYLRFRFSSDERFAAGVPSSERDLYVRVSPDGARHWPTILSKTKALWATRVVIDATDLAAIHIPVLVMAGDHDVIPIEQTVEIYRQLPHAQLLILPATGHATMRDRPEEFDRLTREFLEGARIP